MGYPSKWLSILIQFRGVGVKSCHLFLDNFLLEINKNQPKIAKSWGGLWRLGGVWLETPASQTTWERVGATVFFLEDRTKGNRGKKGNGLPKIRYAKKSPRHTRELFFLSYCTPLVCFFSIDDT